MKFWYVIFKGINYRKLQKKNRNFQNFKLVVPLKALFLGFLLRFFKCCVQDKKKLNYIAAPFQRHYLQFCFLLAVNRKGLSKKLFQLARQVVETIFFASKITFFVEICKNFEFSFFFWILLIQVEENYTKNNDLQYFLFQMKIANAILHADEVL